jgi:hypothetical protein
MNESLHESSSVLIGERSIDQHTSQGASKLSLKPATYGSGSNDVKKIVL